MKELSIEQKAKAYDKALERVKDFIEKQNPPAFDKDLIGTIFPELRESEDEKIRKELIKEINGLWENDSATWPSSLEKKNKYIAWLEKQGEQKPNPCENCGIATNNYQKFPCAIRDGEQNPAWSEEDEEELDIAISTLKEAGQHDSAKWLKSLKDRYTWKPSDEQMKTLEYYMRTLVCNEHKEILFGLYEDLKKLTD